MKHETMGEEKVMWLARFFQICILSMLSPLVMGFESDEHREISDLALSIAIDYHCLRPGVPQSTKCKAIKEAAESLSDEDNAVMSYGKINEVVDFMHYPEQLLDDNLFPAVKKSMNRHAKELLNKRSKFYVFFDYLSASSHNERHFQADLLKSLTVLHQAAVNDARDGHIFRALVRSALSDHFLNDFFAPGHITTPRENSHDTVALAMHDWANKAGVCFKIDVDTWPELDRLLQFIERRDYEILDEKIDVYKLANRNLTMCGNKPDFELVAGMSQEQLQQNVIRNLADSHVKIFLKGDGRLIRNPKQKLFMLLVQVQSISEVIGSFIDCPATPACIDHSESVTRYEWSDSYDNGQIVPPTAKIRYGEYEIEKEHEEESVYVFLKRPKYAYPAVADNAFLISIGGQSLSHEPARFEAQFELLPLKIGTAFRMWRTRMIQRPSSECKLHRRQFCNVGIAYGITHSRKDDFRSTGGQIRFIKVFPKISGQSSLFFRRGKYEGRNQESWENAFGFRYDHGFSLHSFYIGYERGYGFDGAGNFGRENIISFGWTLTFPSSRFLGIFGGYK